MKKVTNVQTKRPPTPVSPDLAVYPTGEKAIVEPGDSVVLNAEVDLIAGASQIDDFGDEVTQGDQAPGETDPDASDSVLGSAPADPGATTEEVYEPGSDIEEAGDPPADPDLTNHEAGEPTSQDETNDPNYIDPEYLPTFAEAMERFKQNPGLSEMEMDTGLLHRDGYYIRKDGINMKTLYADQNK